ncbi:hypothetical protein BKA81DRAFT_352079 [Phyllosticta paracitricarpa]|uniref:Uncharacterized protein n=2 Tax=Phyllosticta TaxID=121621 RepID=A0ABR1MFT4_9PEZI
MVVGVDQGEVWFGFGGITSALLWMRWRRRARREKFGVCTLTQQSLSIESRGKRSGVQRHQTAVPTPQTTGSRRKLPPAPQQYHSYYTPQKCRYPNPTQPNQTPNIPLTPPVHLLTPPFPPFPPLLSTFFATANRRMFHVANNHYLPRRLRVQSSAAVVQSNGSSTSPPMTRPQRSRLSPHSEPLLHRPQAAPPLGALAPTRAFPAHRHRINKDQGSETTRCEQGCASG